MTAVSAETAEGFSRQVAHSFGKACDSYLPAARLQQQVALDALALLPAISVTLAVTLKLPSSRPLRSTEVL